MYNIQQIIFHKTIIIVIIFFHSISQMKVNSEKPTLSI